MVARSTRKLVKIHNIQLYCMFLYNSQWVHGNNYLAKNHTWGGVVRLNGHSMSGGLVLPVTHISEWVKVLKGTLLGNTELEVELLRQFCNWNNYLDILSTAIISSLSILFIFFSSFWRLKQFYHGSFFQIFSYFWNGDKLLSFFSSCFGEGSKFMLIIF